MNTLSYRCVSFILTFLYHYSFMPRSRRRRFNHMKRLLCFDLVVESSEPAGLSCNSEICQLCGNVISSSTAEASGYIAVDGSSRGDASYTTPTNVITLQLPPLLLRHTTRRYCLIQELALRKKLNFTDL